MTTATVIPTAFLLDLSVVSIVFHSSYSPLYCITHTIVKSHYINYYDSFK
jgi:hypothetical protein